MAILKMVEKIKETLATVHFSARYKRLCDRFDDFDNGVTYKKNEIQQILNGLQTIDLKYSSREKLFLKDYDLGEVTARIVLSYKYGFIDCTFAMWTEGYIERISDSFFGIARIDDPEFESKVAYKFPIATSLMELEEILKDTLKLYSDFIEEYSKGLFSEEE